MTECLCFVCVKELEKYFDELVTENTKVIHILTDAVTAVNTDNTCAGINNRISTGGVGMTHKSDSQNVANSKPLNYNIC